eukprot:TRINITY_DN55955_c0_g1_i1.p1 TRINITY_DN55955_c0_g1~~TRINITY_DN55955_c0_g1_i1.p1  ORF type:complete len:123 (+),score=26.83 TRINITY_DN55955_c0_g1_i1:180-548(+)
MCIRDRYQRRVRVAALHSSLMFHSVAPPGFPVVQYVRNSQVHTGTLTPLMCMIDTSVYSRNRVFRCLGSSKLGKSNILVAMERTSSPYLELSLIHISEPTRLLSISYAVFCLKKKKIILNKL